MFRKTVLLIGLAMFVSCAGDIPSVKTLTKHQQSDQVTSASHDSYIIGPGDILSIDVWKETTLSKQVTVRLDGKISLPLVNEIRAIGLTCTQLRNYLTKKYSDYVEFPTVSVTLIESRSKKIYILGRVNRPGEYELLKNMTIIQAISRAGGPTEWAKTSDIRLIRKIKGTERTFTVDYGAIVSSKDLSQNILLEPDDTIFVP
jgi:polysaccharide export outer membrane protein